MAAGPPVLTLATRDDGRREAKRRAEAEARERAAAAAARRGARRGVRQDAAARAHVCASGAQARKNAGRLVLRRSCRSRAPEVTYLDRAYASAPRRLSWRPSGRTAPNLRLRILGGGEETARDPFSGRSGCAASALEAPRWPHARAPRSDDFSPSRFAAGDGPPRVPTTRRGGAACRRLCERAADVSFCERAAGVSFVNAPPTSVIFVNVPPTCHL